MEVINTTNVTMGDFRQQHFSIPFRNYQHMYTFLLQCANGCVNVKDILIMLVQTQLLRYPHWKTSMHDMQHPHDMWEWKWHFNNTEDCHRHCRYSNWLYPSGTKNYLDTCTTRVHPCVICLRQSHAACNQVRAKSGSNEKKKNIPFSSLVQLSQRAAIKTVYYTLQNENACQGW